MRVFHGAGVGLFRASQYVTDLLAMYALSLRHIYKQYIEATSVDCESVYVAYNAPVAACISNVLNFYS